MPFRSEAQRRYLTKNLPEVAAELEAETPASLPLPDHVRRAKPKGLVNAAHASRKAVVRAVRSR